MISVGEQRGLVPMRAASNQHHKPSRLEALQADFQSKILKEKEQKLKKLDNENSRQAKHSNNIREHDSLSAPERKSKMATPNSAGQVQGYHTKKKQGYDKSRPLEPINRNTHNVNGLPDRGYSDPTLLQSSKTAIFCALKRTAYLRESRSQHLQRQEKPTDFQKWRMDQDAADRQRRLNALNKRNAVPSSDYNTRLTEYEQEAAELKQLQEQEEIERRALAVQRKEEERERKFLLKQQQDQKRQEQAEKGRRRKEESERRQRELAFELQRQKEADQVEEDAQAEMIKQLEEKLQEKQRDLSEIQRRKPRDILDYSSHQDSEHYDTSRQDYANSRQDHTGSQLEHRASRLDHRVSRQDHTNNKHAQRNRKATQGTGVIQRNARLDNNYSEHSNSDDDVYVPPTRPKRVTRKDGKSRSTQPAVDVSSQPTQVQNLPHKLGAKVKQHELNSTYRVSREKSIPIAAQTEELPPFVVDGEGLDVVLAECSVCGRRFAEDRLTTHQKACKKSHKTRKQFNAAAHRIAGSGAEQFQYKRKRAETKKIPKKDWRAQREEFISAIRYAKKAAAIEAQGGNVAELLPPPPKAENPDYVQCPHCSRRFNETAAERHIPKCKDIKAKPTALKRGSRR
ncbi:zinc finger C2HC domain-containing protein 1C-like isoform X2 [Watersipora subatra]|uniref:zinc finger C2HC domain-containing protein 1C-like isoform X2 n=1 Tax=Watersipora subatra TaxID=2589382 RepID=UPI00355B11F0